MQRLSAKTIFAGLLASIMKQMCGFYPPNKKRGDKQE
jgi:hypothetical protein